LFREVTGDRRICHKAAREKRPGSQPDRKRHHSYLPDSGSARRLGRTDHSRTQTAALARYGVCDERHSSGGREQRRAQGNRLCPEIALCILEKTGNPLLLDTGKPLIVPWLAFTPMHVQARNLDASPWVPEVSNHQRILDALRMGDPHLVEQTVVHITSLFLKAALAVWASG
jgi:DNA-binding FadR family transcriptional regulator